jgi:SAM-dependent methyltransferase
MEFGPLALGARSIVGDARDPRMRATIERQLDFRESHRPVAGAVLAEHAAEYFEVPASGANPSALHVAPLRESKRTPPAPGAARARGLEKLRLTRSVVPAVTHVDDCARVQAVDGASDGLFRRLLLAVHERTGCPVVVNTGFRLGWDTLVRSPRDAYRAFMASELDVLCMGPYVLRKRDQPGAVRGARAEEDEVLDGLLASPCCRAALAREAAGYRCAACAHVFPIDRAEDRAAAAGIPQLFWPHEGIADSRDVTDRVKEFYEETPFPNYDDHDSARSLVEKSRRGLYARRLDETIPYNTTLLEVGCGTGQLTNFLGLGCRRVVGTDMCLNSLRLGDAFRREHELGRVRFAQMNLFRPCFRPGSFDVVLCNGVLHHTADPAGGFRVLAELVKPGGHFVLGLYNAYGRLMTDLRRQLFRLTGGRARWIDPILRRGLGSDKHRAWFADQYRHPHESKHTTGEVLRWFDRAGLEFVRGIPALRPDDEGLDGASLFEPLPRGSPLERLLAQAMQVLATGQKEGGFFVMIARRPERARAEGGAVDGDRRVRP